MKGFIKFNRGLLKMPIPWQMWLMLLVSINLVVPLFYLDRPEAQAVLAAFIASMPLFSILTARFGFTRILGFGHIFWVPLIVFLLSRLASIPGTDIYGIWVRALLVLNGISLVIDAADVLRYFRGDRAETVAFG